MKPLLWLSLTALLAVNVRACIWDADSLAHEKSRSHDLATTILGEPPAAEDTNKLSARIKELEAVRNETSADWWNNLAGAYLRLNQPAEAAKLLEPVVSKFPNDYGIHANLGTAYHLLGRYAEAEKEIARDLEINPAAHFGLEKYHLALLQYLMRDAKYQSRHVYVDEWTATFWCSGRGHLFFTDANERVFKAMAEDYTNGLAEAEADYESLSKSNHNEYDLGQMLGTVAALDNPPSYRTNWNLANDTNFEAGVIYMAQMNPKEPACFEMLGIAAWRQHNYHLAISAFEKAIALGSQKSDLLKSKINGLNDYIAQSSAASPNQAVTMVSLCLLSIPLLIAYYIYSKFRDRRRQLAAK